MTIKSRGDFFAAVPDRRVTLSVDEGPGSGNSAPTKIVFHRFDADRTDQVVEASGEWERYALAEALRWIADELDPPDSPERATERVEL